MLPTNFPQTSPVLGNFDDTNVPDDGLNLQGTLLSDRGLRSMPQSGEPLKTRLPVEEPIHSTYPALISILTPAQQEKLRSISIPQHLQYRTEHSPQSAGSICESCSISSNSRKRKISEDNADNEGSENNRRPPAKNITYNMIEKRYRSNLNDKIAALRNSVPSLRELTKRARGEDAAGNSEDLQGLTPVHKLSKSTVLEKAVEYIHHLEKRNTRLTEEKTVMKAHITAFEKRFMSNSPGTNPIPSKNSHLNVQKSYMALRINSQGMIDVPGDLKRLHAASLSFYPRPSLPHSVLPRL